METIGQLTGGIAHDFNNLLTVVRGYSEILQTNINSGQFSELRAQRALLAIQQATERGSKLTSQLLAFARKQKIEGRVLNLVELINQVMPLITQTVGSGVTVKLVSNG